jgi:hypothetical protein
MKASQEARFSLDRKYDKIAVYALTYKEAFDLLDKREHTKRKSWTVNGGWSVPNPGKDWMNDLEQYLMTPERWRQRIQSAVKS